MDERLKPRGEVHIEYHSPYGIYSVDYRGRPEQNSYSLMASGSLAFVDRRLHFSKPIHDGFALVRVGRLKGVKVMHSNQDVGKTNKKGRVACARAYILLSSREVSCKIIQGWKGV